MKHLPSCKKVVKVRATRCEAVSGLWGHFPELVTTEEWRCSFECPIRRCRQGHGDLPEGTLWCPKCGEWVGG